jgi:CRISPR-associated endonuclease/helicase Cas3
MSLDLSADLLVTDIAPVPALIQRLGRLNRKATRESSAKPGLVMALPEGNNNASAPYLESDLTLADQWLTKLAEPHGPCSQKKLATIFSEIAPGATFDLEYAEEMASFVGVAGESGLWRTRPGTTRVDGYTIPVILAEDEELWVSANGSKEPKAKWLREHEVAIPSKPKVAKWRTLAGVPIAERSDVFYDYDKNTHEGTGAEWVAS